MLSTRGATPSPIAKLRPCGEFSMGSQESTRVRFTAALIIVLNALPIALILRKFLGRKLPGITTDRQRPAFDPADQPCAVRINNPLASVWSRIGILEENLDEGTASNSVRVLWSLSERFATICNEGPFACKKSPRRCRECGSFGPIFFATPEVFSWRVTTKRNSPRPG